MSKEAVVATALYVLGRVRSRAYGGSDVDNAVYYLNKLRDLLASAGVDAVKVEQLIRENASMSYINYAVGRSLEPSLECPGNSSVVIDFVSGDKVVTVGPALTLDVVRHGVKARGSYQDIVNEIDRYVNSLAGLRMDYQQLVETLLAVMKLTILYVPYSNCDGGNHYSAYAVAHAAMAYASTDGNYRLLGIDVVGIQDIIGRIQRTKQAMRQLKGRSILINLVQQAAAIRLINDVNKALRGDVLSPANVLMNTGGEVVMLIPDVSEGVLNEAVDDVESAVISEFEGRLGLVIAYTKAHGVDASFREVLDELERELTRRRYGRYRRVHINGVDLCSMCGMASENLEQPDDTTLRMCPFCSKAHKIGTVSRRLGFIARLRTSNYGRIRDDCKNVNLLGIDYAICSEEVSPICSNEYVHYHLNELRFSCMGNVANSVIFLNTIMPTDPETGDVMDLEKIRMGDMAITVRADANSMGRIKANAARDAATYAFFTNLLTTIFDAYGAYLIGSNQARYGGGVFLIYSGGDDVVVVGDYMALDYIARLITRANEFSINVAAGAMVHEVHQPIYLVWLEAEDRLARAKERNRNSSLIYVMDADRAPIILEPGDVLDIVNYVSMKHNYADLEEGQGVSPSMLYRLNRHFVEIYNALYEVVSNGGNCLDAKRRLLRAIIEYTYYYNRNRDTVSQAVSELGRELMPENLVNLLRNIKCGSEDGVGQYLRILGRAIASVNIYVLKARSEGGAGW